MDYDIKKGNYGKLEGDGLKKMVEAAFGSVKEEGGALVSSYGAMTRIEVRLVSKTSLDISAVTDKNASPDLAASTIKRWNEFLERPPASPPRSAATACRRRPRKASSELVQQIPFPPGPLYTVDRLV